MPFFYNQIYKLPVWESILGNLSLLSRVIIQCETTDMPEALSISAKIVPLGNIHREII